MDNGEHTSSAPLPDQPSATPMPPGAQAANDEMALLLEDARAKADDHWDQLLRTKADMENLRRRAERDVESAHKYALERFAAELIPVKDSLELGLAAADSAGAADELGKLREGMTLTHKMLHAALEKFGIKEISPLGEKFNSGLHQAMSMQPTAEAEPNTVLKVFQKGYTLHDRVLRPAMVVVAQAPAVP